MYVHYHIASQDHKRIHKLDATKLTYTIHANVYKMDVSFLLQLSGTYDCMYIRTYLMFYVIVL